jgi:hypothetical protein
MERGGGLLLLCLTSFEVGPEEFFHLVKRNLPVIQVGVVGSRNNHQFFVAAAQESVCIFTEIAGMGIMALIKYVCFLLFGKNG